MKKENLLVIGGLIIVAICISMVCFLIYQSMMKGTTIPEYALAFFSSTTTLILGYLFGRKL